MKSIVCESCRSVNTRVLLENQSHVYRESYQNTPWRYDLLQCKECGMGFIFPKPDFKTLQTFYSSDYGCYASTTDLTKEAKSFKYWIAKLRYANNLAPSLRRATETLFAMLAELITGKAISYSLGIPLNLHKKARILEVGYGSGSWLLIMASLGYTELDGYDIEANKENKTKLTEAGVKVQSGNLFDVAYPDNFFDCIRLEHSFEHLLDPVQVLAELHRILKPGGNLVMNFPSVNSISLSLSVLHYAHRDSPRHLFLHTTASVSNMLMSNYFNIRGIREYAVAGVFSSTINNIIKAAGIPFKIKGFSVISPIYNIINIVVRRGEAISVWAQK